MVINENAETPIRGELRAVVTGKRSGEVLFVGFYKKRDTKAFSEEEMEQL